MRCQLGTISRQCPGKRTLSTISRQQPLRPKESLRALLLTMDFRNRLRGLRRGPMASMLPAIAILAMSTPMVSEQLYYVNRVRLMSARDVVRKSEFLMCCVGMGSVRVRGSRSTL